MSAKSELLEKEAFLNRVTKEIIEAAWGEKIISYVREEAESYKVQELSLFTSIGVFVKDSVLVTVKSKNFQGMLTFGPELEVIKTDIKRRVK